MTQSSLPPLTGRATLDVSDFRKGIAQIQGDLASLQKRGGTIKLTADLSATKRVKADLDGLRADAAKPIKIGANGEGLRDVDRIIKDLTKSVGSVRDAWRLEAISNDEATLAAQRHRNELLKLAAAEDTNREAMERALKAAAQAQNLMNQAQGVPTRGGFAFNASLGILDALGALGGPAGQAAATIGNFITQGLTRSLDQGKQAVAQESGELSDEIVQAIKAKLRIQSPSKVMEEVGEFVVEGLIRGFKSETSTLLAVVRQTGAQVPAAFAQGAQGISGGAFSGVAAEFQEAGEAADVLTPKLGKAGGELQNTVNVAEELTYALAPVAAGVLAFGAALAFSVPKAADFQKAMQAIAAESDLTAVDLKEIGDGLIEVSNDIGTSSINLAKATYDIVGAGVAGAEANAEVVKLARQSATLAGAGMTNVATAADVLTSALNAYGLSATSAASVSDTLFQITNVGKISMEQIGAQMGEVFPLAAQLGVNLDTLGASVATLTSVGIPAAQAVTGMRGVFQNILNPSAEASKAAQALGFSFDAATLKAKGLTVFLRDVTKATGGSAAAMSELFGDVDAINAVFALTSDVGGRKYTEALEKMAKANGATAAGFEDAANTYAHAQEKFRTSIENLQITFASRYLPTITKGVEATSKFIQSIDEFGQNSVVQFALVTGGAVLMANTFIKLGTAVKGAATSTALFQAVANAGGISAYLASIGGLTGAMTALTGATVGATIAAAPLAVVAAAVGTAFASWKLGQLIGELKLFGDETTTLNDKLTDFFATTLFGADPELIRQMREQEEAEQRRALAAGETAKSQEDVAAAIRATAAAEAAAIAAQNKAAAAREAEIAKVKAQKAALEDLNKTLEERQFKAGLIGKTELQKDLAELGRAFDELAEKAAAAFGGDEKNPQLQSALKRLSSQRASEERAIRAQHRQEAAKERAKKAEKAAKERADAARTAQDYARQTQALELQGMQEGAAKKKALRDRELDDIRQDAAERIKALAGYPEQQRQIEADSQRQLAALRRKHGEEDRELAIQNARRVTEAQQSAEDAQIAAMAEGRAKREAERARDLENLRETIAEKVRVLAGDPEAQASVQGYGQQEVDALVRQQAQQRAQEEREAQAQVTEAREAARAAEIAALTNEAAIRRANREQEIRDFHKSIQDRLDAVAGYPEKEAAILQAAREQSRSIERKWANEDEQEAKARAGRIAAVWRAAQEAQANAQAAGRDNQAAQYELRLSRQLAAAKDNAVQVARIEQQAVQERAQLAQRAAVAGYTEERTRLEQTRDDALRAENLSAQERTAIWRTYYANLNTLSATYQAAENARRQAQEEAERQAAENLRRARVEAAERPAQQAERGISRLEANRELARSDAEILEINTQISAQRAGQITTYQAMLANARSLSLTTEERQEIEDQIARLQHDQAVSLREQLDAAHALRQSTLDRLDAEAQHAERVATSEAERSQAQARQLAVAGLRVRELDTLIAAEGREEERNRLIGERFSLLGQIADLQDRLNAAPYEAEERRLALYQAQARAELALRGLGNDRVAQARLAQQIAANELLLANRRLGAARGELAIQAALSDQAAARLAFYQAMVGLQEVQAQTVTPAEAEPPESARERLDRIRRAEDEAEGRRKTLEAAREADRKAVQEALTRQLTLENSLLDATEARARAVLQITGEGENAVRAAEQELQATRDRLALIRQQLGTELDPAARADLLKTQLSLLGQEGEGQRKLTEARRAARELAEELTQAERDLTRELEGGAQSARAVDVATRGVAESRTALARSEREYAEARAAYDRQATPATTQRLKGATDNLTASIRAQRDAVRSLADAYREQIAQQDGVRDAADRLKTVAYGETGQPFDSRRERQRLQAIEQRRDAAQKELREALASGEEAAIQKATEDLARQEERYKKQADLMEKNGVKFTRTGEQETRRLADQVDALGIQYDREAALLEERAEIADTEAAAARQFSTAAERFEDTTTTLTGALEGVYAQLQTALKDSKAAADSAAADSLTEQRRELERTRRRWAEDDATPTETRPAPTTGERKDTPQPVLTPRELDAMAAKFAAPIGPSVARAVAPLVDDASPAEVPGLPQDWLREGAALTQALRQFLDAQRTAFTAPRTPTLPNVLPISHSVTHNYGPIHITQLPGENADALANRVIDKLQDRARRSGRNC